MGGVLVAVLAGLGAMLGWGFADFFAKKTIDAIGDVTSLVWAHVFGTAFFAAAAGIFAVTNGNTPGLVLDWSHWAGLLVFGIGQAAVYLLVYYGFGKGQLSVLNPIFASYSGLAAVISVLLLGEQASPVLLILVVVFAGILMISVSPGSKTSHGGAMILRAPGVLPVLAASALAAFWTVYWARFVNNENALTYAALMYVFMTATALAYAVARRVPLALDRKAPWTALVLIGACEAGAYMSLTFGFSATTATSLIAVVSGAFSLPTMILSRAYLGERLTRLQLAGAAAIVGGVTILAAFQ